MVDIKCQANTGELFDTLKEAQACEARNVTSSTILGLPWKWEDHIYDELTEYMVDLLNLFPELDKLKAFWDNYYPEWRTKNSSYFEETPIIDFLRKYENVLNFVNFN